MSLISRPSASVSTLKESATYNNMMMTCTTIYPAPGPDSRTNERTPQRTALCWGTLAFLRLSACFCLIPTAHAPPTIPLFLWHPSFLLIPVPVQPPARKATMVTTAATLKRVIDDPGPSPAPKKTRGAQPNADPPTPDAPNADLQQPIADLQPLDDNNVDKGSWDVMKILVPATQRHLKKYLMSSKELGNHKCELFQHQPLNIVEAGADMKSFKQPWTRPLCMKSMGSTGLFEAGCNLMWVNADTHDPDLELEPQSWTNVVELTSLFAKNKEGRIIYPVPMEGYVRNKDNLLRASVSYPETILLFLLLYYYYYVYLY